jgi:leucyl-tRNA---protein transferase
MLTEEDRALFVEHRTRFKFDPPDDLHGFLGDAPDVVPCVNVACRARLGERLVALSFLDLGQRAASSVYGCFALDQSARSLGLWTMLQEIILATARGQEWYYPGYVYHEPSFYDYKKRFRPYQWFDWQGQWREE